MNQEEQNSNSELPEDKKMDENHVKDPEGEEASSKNSEASESVKDNEEEDDDDDDEDYVDEEETEDVERNEASTTSEKPEREMNGSSLVADLPFTELSLDYMEPSGELGEGDEDERKSRFNLRKRSAPHSSADDYASEEEFEQEQEAEDNAEPDLYEGQSLKLNLSKKNYRRQRPYTNEAVKAAVKMVQTKRMSILEASRAFNIPRTSLHNFVRLYKRGRRMGVKALSPGLSKEEEQEMVSLVKKLSRCGKRYSHNELRFLVQYYLISNDRPVFKSGTLPTMGWIAGLVERHPELTKAKSKKNTKVASEDVEEWHEYISDYLITDWNLDLEEMFSSENYHRIFCFNAFKMLINGPGENSENRPPQARKDEEEKYDQEASVILGMSADGDYVSPLLVFSEENKEVSLRHNSSYLRTHFNKTGRVDDEVAMRLVKDFNQELQKTQIAKPVIFFVNDKQDLAHFSVIEYCWENQICIVCLPPKTSRTMTPFEVNIWPKMRAAYGNVWRNAPKNNENKILAEQFPAIFMQAWESIKSPKHPLRGFVKSGLIPFNVTKILKEAPEHVDDYMAEQEEYIPKEFTLMEERSRGKIEGIQMCLEAIESFIPPDVLPVWSQREPDYRGRCELAFKLWRSVSLLLKAGCAMASIQQMADGFGNPFGADFTSPTHFFQRSSPTPDSHPPSRSESPTLASPSLNHSSEKPIQRKRKLNKSIYSSSELTNGDLEVAQPKKAKPQSENKPFVKLYQDAFLMSEDVDDEVA